MPILGPDSGSFNWSPCGALLINVFFGWELWPDLAPGTGIYVAGTPGMYKKTKDVPEGLPEWGPEMTLFRPNSDPNSDPEFSHKKYPRRKNIQIPDLDNSLPENFLTQREFSPRDFPDYRRSFQNIFPATPQKNPPVCISEFQIHIQVPDLDMILRLWDLPPPPRKNNSGNSPGNSSP